MRARTHYLGDEQLAASVFPDIISEMSSELASMLKSNNGESVPILLQILGVVKDEVNSKKVISKLLSLL